MPNAHLTEAQKLDPSAIIELFTLDTSTCVLSSTPGVHSLGEVYRWAAGNVEQRESGTLAQTAASGTVITVERQLTYDSQASYQFSCVNPSTGQWTAPTAVAAISNSVITLAMTLGFTPPAGTPWNLYAQHPVRFNGVAYQPMPIEATGFEWSGQGKLPRPKLRVSNIGGLAGGLLIAFGDLLGATVTRVRTFARFLDGMPTADPTAYFEEDRFIVDRKAAHMPALIEFELASELDQIGLRLPRRQMLRNTCGLSYRKAGGSVNLVRWSDYNAADWVNSFPASATITTGIDDAFGGNKAVRFAGTGSGGALLRVNHPSFTANGSDTYTISFYCRLVTLGTGGANCDLRDELPNGSYLSDLVQGEWVRISKTGVPAAGGKSWTDLFNNAVHTHVLDFCGVQVQRGALSPLQRTAGALIGNTWSYGTCPYTGNAMFKIDNTTTLVMSEDVCDHHISGCKARFGNEPLPIDAFPGLGLVRA